MPISSLLLASLTAAGPIAETDSLKNFDIEEAVVVASPKETQQLRRQALSVSLFDEGQLGHRRVESLKGLSAYAPNVYMPSYGSRLTSACYIRGIGSRINTPAVGLYVDNVPYIDKSAYDFSFTGVDRVDVLRGPQGTLYGRNTMGGLVRVFTADPITHQGTELGTGWSSRNGGRRASVTSYLHPADRMGLSVNAYYEGQNGFFKNAYNGKKQDAQDAGGGRLRWSWRPTDVVKLDWTASYEQSNEEACPYYWQGTVDDSGQYAANSDGETLAQNRPSTYRRKLFNTGLGVEHRLPHVVLTSITAYQHLRDRHFMDQDFTSADIFSLEQRQFSNTFSEEIALKSPAGPRRWQWSTGFFGMYQHLRTDCPVTFYQDGVDMLNARLASVMPQSPSISLAFTDSQLPFAARFFTPTVNLALYHQSTVHFTSWLSLTLGVRLDYDARKLEMSAPAYATTVPYHFSMQMGPVMRFDKDLTANPSVTGHVHNDSWQVLPKGALNFRLPDNLGNVYLSVAKGYRSGGYNIQSYSELSQNALQRSMMLGVKDYSISTINALPLPEAQKQGAIMGMTSVLDRYTPDVPNIHTLSYKPEYTWSYEFGIHHNLAGQTLQLDLSAFYMKTRDQQLARFAESGLGRIMVNAGRSRSVGVEAAVRSVLCSERLQLKATYGFTRATFTNYDLGQNGDVTVDYTGNRVPFVPEHTFSASADFRQPLSGGLWMKAIGIGADVKGAGSVVWNEANTFSQPLYATLNARITLELPAQVSLDLWAQNLTASRYATFSFESMSNRYAQYGQPRHFGVDVKWRF